MVPTNRMFLLNVELPQPIILEKLIRVVSHGSFTNGEGSVPGVGQLFSYRQRITTWLPADVRPSIYNEVHPGYSRDFWAE